VDADFVLVEEGEDLTWGDDLTILITKSGSAPLLQIGGFNDLGADTHIGWPNGQDDAAGTAVGGTVSIGGIDVTGCRMTIGNGYLSGGPGVWSGTVTFTGTMEFVCTD
jgi:hypothetical protein